MSEGKSNSNPIIKSLRYLNGFQPTPRINRTRYFTITTLYLSALIATLWTIPILKESTPIISIIIGLATVIISVLLTINIFLIIIKRLHDLDYSGWWALISIIPTIGAAFELGLLFTKGIKGKNRFGSQPKKPSKPEYWLAIILIPIRIFLTVVLVAYYLSKKPS